MLHEDYMIRMLRPLSVAIAALLDLKKNEIDEEKRGAQYEDALLILDRAAQQLLGLSMLLVNQMPVEALLEMLGLDSPTGAGKTLILAYLLKEEGTIYGAKGNPDESYPYYVKSLTIYFEVLRVKGVAEIRDQFAEIDAVVELLEPYTLPDKTRRGLMRYFEVIGKYARVEDILFDMVEAHPDDRELIQAGIDFYGRLREESDGQLAAGNLPRHEVESSLKELLALQKKLA